MSRAAITLAPNTVNRESFSEGLALRSRLELTTRRLRGGNHQTSGSRVDGTDRPERDPEHLGISGWMPLCSARSCHEVLCIVSVRVGSRRCEEPGAARQKSESERLCGTLGSVRQRRVSVEVDSGRRRRIITVNAIIRQRRQAYFPGCRG